MDSKFQSLKEEMHKMQKNYNNHGGDHSSKNDDTPMCERHEANYTRSEDYQNQNSHDSYSHQSRHDLNDFEKSLTELNNDVRNDLEDFKRKVQKKNDVKARKHVLMALQMKRLQKIVSQLAILGEHISQEDLNLIFLRSLPSEWNTHVVVWRNKPDLDTMSFDDLYNNFIIVEQEVKGTASLSSSSQNVAFVSSSSSTNELLAYKRLIRFKTKDLQGFYPACGNGEIVEGKEKEFQQPEFKGYGPNPSKSVSEDTSNEFKESPDAPLFKELVSDDKLEKKTVFPIVATMEFPVLSVEVLTMYRLTAITINGKGWYLGIIYKARPKGVNTARPNLAVVNDVRANQGHPQKEDQGYVDSGCSRHMTRNMSYLSDFKEFNGGYVTFGGGAKGGKITGKGTLKTSKLDFEDVYFVKELQFNLFYLNSQMCDKKNIVLFTNTGCFVLSSDFKLADES
ncbi:hypothetical protein Tco_1563032 [Tanacetum coccineum]